MILKNYYICTHKKAIICFFSGAWAWRSASVFFAQNKSAPGFYAGGFSSLDVKTPASGGVNHSGLKTFIIGKYFSE